MDSVLKFLGDNKETITAVIGVATFIAALVKYFLDAHRERTSIEYGFLVEVERLLWVISRHRREHEKFKDDPLIPFTTDFYDKQIENVGKIARSLIPDIIRFYGFVKFLNQIQAARPAYVLQAKQADFNDFYEAQIDHFLKQFETPFHRHFLRHHLTPPFPGSDSTAAVAK